MSSMLGPICTRYAVPDTLGRQAHAGMGVCSFCSPRQPQVIETPEQEDDLQHALLRLPQLHWHVASDQMLPMMPVWCSMYHLLLACLQEPSPPLGGPSRAKQKPYLPCLLKLQNRRVIQHLPDGPGQMHLLMLQRTSLQQATMGLSASSNSRLAIWNLEMIPAQKPPAAQLQQRSMKPNSDFARPAHS